MGRLAPDDPPTIGKYRVLQKLGEGATSEVFLAYDDFHDRQVAIKRVRPSAGRSEADLHFSSHFFAAEAALVGRLNHPNVVQIHDAVEDPVSPYLVMEYVPGSTLRTFCQQDRLLPLEQVVEIGFKCAMALGYVYRQGLIHRDVKPANILAVTDGPEVLDIKLTDFGSVLNLGADRTQIHRVGSLAYMSPEQLEGSTTLDGRADIYSLAAVLYHMIAGKPPFEAESHGALLNMICHADAEPLLGLREGVSPALDRTIRGALAKSPADRPGDWDEFAQSLSSLITNHEVPRGQLQRVLDSERFNLLRDMEFFDEFGDVELWEVVHRAKWQRFPFGHRIFKRGQEGKQFYCIAQGEVAVELQARSGAGDAHSVRSGACLVWLRMSVRAITAASLNMVSTLPGMRRRQFGCWSVVPGRLGASARPSRSSIGIIASGAGVMPT